MTSSFQAIAPSRSTTESFRENLNRCSSSKNSNSGSGTGVGLFDSSKLRNIKANILQEISSKWEATFSDAQSGTPLESHVTSKAGFDMPAGGSISAQTSINRKHKMRSVYGQPEVVMPSPEQTGGGFQNNNKQWSSLDSLDTYDSGNGGMGSNSTSCSDLRLTESQHQGHHFNLKEEVTTTATSAVCSSDLATSVESSDNEQEQLQSGYSKHRARCPSSNSTSSGCSIDSQSEVDEVARKAKSFMRDFVRKIFFNR